MPGPAASKAAWAAAIDIGASKMAALIGAEEAPGVLRVHGFGVQTPLRTASGDTRDFEAAVRALRIALDEAERMSGRYVQSAIGAYSGPGVRSRRSVGAIKLLRGRVDREDVRGALAAAREAAVGAGRAPLHVAPIAYRVDGGPPVLDPRGCQGATLNAEALVVSAPANAVEGVHELAREAGVVLERLVAGPYAAALGAIDPETREDGALLLDLGAGCVGLAAFRGGLLVHCETLPIGGRQVTQELAAQLGSSFAAAERAKIAFGGVVGRAAHGVQCEAARLGEDGRLEAVKVDPAAIQTMMAPAVEQILRRAAEAAAQAGLDGQAAPEVVVCGGGALAAGMRERCARAFGRPAAAAAVEPLESQGFEGSSAPFAAAVGLLRWALERPPEAAAPSHVRPAAAQAPAPRAPLGQPPAPLRGDGAMGRAFSWLRDNL